MGKHITLENLKRYDTNVKERENTLIEENCTFTNETPLVEAHGGIAAGTTFDKKPIKEILKEILYKYVAPVVTISTSPNGGIFENGTTQIITKATVTITKKSENITKIEIIDGESVVETKTDEITNGGVIEIPLSINVTTAKQISVKVTDASGKSVTAKAGAFSFVNPIYYGATTETTVTEEIIKALTKKVEAKGNKTYNFTTNNSKMVFAYPQSYGALKKIFDANNFDVTDTFNLTTVTVSGVIYNVYVQANPSTVSNFAMKFNFS